MKKTFLICLLIIASAVCAQGQKVGSPVCYAYADTLTLKYKHMFSDGRFYTALRLITRSTDMAKEGDCFVFDTKQRGKVPYTITHSVASQVTPDGFYPFEIDGGQLKAFSKGLRRIYLVRGGSSIEFDVFYKKGWAKRITKRVNERMVKRAAVIAQTDGPKQEFQKTEYIRKQKIKEERLLAKEHAKAEKLLAQERMRTDARAAREKERIAKKTELEKKIAFEIERRTLIDSLAREKKVRLAREKDERKAQQTEAWNERNTWKNEHAPTHNTRQDYQPRHYPSWRDK